MSSSTIVDHSTWCRASWVNISHLPGFSLGRWQLWKPTEVRRQQQVDIVRLYPKSLSLDPERTKPSSLIAAAFALGYQACPQRAIEEVKHLTSRRKGYIIAPVVGGTQTTLLVWTGGKIQEVDCPYPDTYQGLGNTWSIIVAKP